VGDVTLTYVILHKSQAVKLEWTVMWWRHHRRVVADCLQSNA